MIVAAMLVWIGAAVALIVRAAIAVGRRRRLLP